MIQTIRYKRRWLYDRTPENNYYIEENVNVW